MSREQELNNMNDEQDIIEKACIALSRRCHVDGFRFMNFMTHDVIFVGMVLVANFMRESSGKTYNCFVYVVDKKNRCKKLLDMPHERKSMTPLDTKDVLKMLIESGHDICLDGTVFFVLNAVHENAPIWIWRDECDTLESLAIEWDLKCLENV